VIRDSYFSGNYTTFDGEGDIYNLSPFAFILASDNYWSDNVPSVGSVPVGIVSTQPQLFFDPTSPSANGTYAVPECAPRLPVLPPQVCTNGAQGQPDNPESDPCQPNPTPVPTSTPIPVLVLCSQAARGTIIAQLSTYYRFNITESSWLDDGEVREICLGVTKTASALKSFADATVGGVSYTSEHQAFTSIMMDSAYSITYSITDSTVVGEFNCLSGLNTIVCGVSNVMSEYTMAHELGHVFVARTQQINQGPYPCPPSGSTTLSFNDCMQNPVAPTSALKLPGNLFVFGPRAINYTQPNVQLILDGQGLTERFPEPEEQDKIPTASDFTYHPVDPIINDQGTPVPQPDATENDAEFYRGEQGWGSTVNSPGTCGTAATDTTGFSSFQQNPCQVFTWIELEITRAELQTAVQQAGLEQAELTEAAADMFLNWVYRTNGQGGFAGDEFGNARFTWMNSTLTTFFSYYGW